MKKIFTILLMAICLPAVLTAQVRVNNMTIGRDGYIHQYGWKIKIKSPKNVWINGHKMKGSVDVIVYNRDKIKVNGRDVTSQVKAGDKEVVIVNNETINVRDMDIVSEGSFSKSTDGMYELRDTLMASATEKGIDEIQCSQVVLDVLVLPSENDEVKVTAHVKYLKTSNPEYGIDITRVGSRLTINQKGGAGSFRGAEGVIEIKIPASSMTGLNIHTTSGDIFLKGVDVGYVKLGSTSGTLKVQGMKINNGLTLKTTSGGVNVSEVSGNIMVAATSVSGGVNVSHVECDKISVATVSGGVNIGSCQTPMVMARSVSGGVNMTGDNRNMEDVSVKTTSGGIKLGLPYDVEHDYSYELQGVSTPIKVGDIRASRKFYMKKDNARAFVSCSTVSGSITIYQEK